MVLVLALGGTVVVSLGLAALLGSASLTAVLTALLGLVGFAGNPVLNSRVFAFAPNARTLAAAGNVAAFNAGISLGPWLGGLALGAGAGYRTLPVIGAALAVLALLILRGDLVLARRADPAGRAGTTAPADRSAGRSGTSCPQPGR
ncbi:hypothetical protein [Nakamurella aerolata]|uniref:hypothetical protein n=1 Tax=Nakamurella aerolata TaxID=1656892 RepID=UPI001BB224A5|nr:hypothetical protein [Nakamurella aerolata]